MIRGSFSVGGPAGWLIFAASLTAAAAGCGGSSLSGDASADGGGSPGQGLAVGGLFVTVVDLGSQPLAGVTVTTDPGATSLISDDFGTVLIRSLSPGFYAVTGVHPIAGAARAAVAVTAGAVTQVRLVLRPVLVAPGSDGGVIDLGQSQDLPVGPDGGKDAGNDRISPQHLRARVRPQLILFRSYHWSCAGARLRVASRLS